MQKSSKKTYMAADIHTSQKRDRNIDIPVLICYDQRALFYGQRFRFHPQILIFYLKYTWLLL